MVGGKVEELEKRQSRALKKVSPQWDADKDEILSGIAVFSAVSASPLLRNLREKKENIQSE